MIKLVQSAELVQAITTGDIATVVKMSIGFSQHKKYQDLMEQISAVLKSKEQLSPDFTSKLVKYSHEEWFQESLTQVVTKSLLSNATIVVRMMAVLVAEKVESNPTDLSYQEIILLRTLEQISNEEIIYLKKMHAKRENRPLSENSYFHYSDTDDAYMNDHALFKLMINSLEKLGLGTGKESVGLRYFEFNALGLRMVQLYETTLTVTARPDEA